MLRFDRGYYRAIRQFHPEKIPDKVKDELEKLPGTSEVDVNGGIITNFEFNTIHKNFSI